MTDKDVTPEYKVCRVCSVELHHSLFYKSKGYRNGIESRCKKCKISQNAARNRLPAVKQKRSEAASKKWRSDEAHRQRLVAHQKEYRSRPGVSEHYSKINHDSYILRRDRRCVETGWVPLADREDRLCSRCKERKPLSDYYQSRGELSSRCKSCTKIAVQSWIQANPERTRARYALYREKNRERIRGHSRALWVRHKTNPAFRLKAWLRSSLGRAVTKGGVKKGAFDLLGYSPDEFKQHIERQFLKGMSWDNRAEWHIDHIIPLSSFNIESRSDPELRIAWGLPNLRPIWARENLIKNAKMTHLI